MAIGIAGGAHDRRLTALIDPKKMVRLRRSLHRIDGDGGTAIGAVLVADRHRQAGRHLAVGLALGGAGTDGGPADQISDVLGHHGIQQFRGGGHPSRARSSSTWTDAVRC